MLSAFLWKHQTVQNKRLSSKFGSRPNLASMVSSADSSESLLSELCCTSTARILMIPLFFLQMYAHQAFYPMLKINMKMRILIGYLSSIFFFFLRGSLLELSLSFAFLWLLTMKRGAEGTQPIYSDLLLKFWTFAKFLFSIVGHQL